MYLKSHISITRYIYCIIETCNITLLLSTLVFPGSDQEDHAERRRGGEGGRPGARHHLPGAGDVRRDVTAQGQESDQSAGSKDSYSEPSVSSLQGNSKF